MHGPSGVSSSGNGAIWNNGGEINKRDNCRTLQVWGNINNYDCVSSGKNDLMHSDGVGDVLDKSQSDKDYAPYGVPDAPNDKNADRQMSSLLKYREPLKSTLSDVEEEASVSDTDESETDDSQTNTEVPIVEISDTPTECSSSDNSEIIQID